MLPSGPTRARSGLPPEGRILRVPVAGSRRTRLGSYVAARRAPAGSKAQRGDSVGAEGSQPPVAAGPVHAEELIAVGDEDARAPARQVVGRSDLDVDSGRRPVGPDADQVMRGRGGARD